MKCERILLIARFFPPLKGGSTRWYHEIYTRYDAGTVVVLTQVSEGCQTYDANSSLKIVRMQSWGSAFLHPKWAGKYISIFYKSLALARVHRVSVIHCDVGLPSGLIAYMLSKILGLPYIMYAHGEEIQSYARLFPESFVTAFVYRHAHKIIANSNYTKTLLLGFGVSEDNIALIHPGVDTKKFSPANSADFWRNKLDLEGKRVILTVGRLIERKGHDQVIRSVQQVLKIFPNLVYIIAGTGEDQSRLRQLVSDLRLQHSVFLLGAVEDELLPALYAAAEVFVMPNRETESRDIEGFGMVFLEANASGLPVIAGCSGGTMSAVIDGTTGVLVNGQDVLEISNAIIRLLSDREYARKLGTAGRERAVCEFDWKIGADKIKALVPAG